MPTSSREDFVNGLLTAFVGLARKYPDAKLVFSGGAASLTHPELKETLVARQLFSDLGLDTSRVIFEDRARKTSENAILTYALVQPKPDQTWLLITSAIHMPRSVGVFRRAGWRILPYQPVDEVGTGHKRPGLIL